jgi:quaternary ammonium compound-resistance protein SugE
LKHNKSHHGLFYSTLLGLGGRPPSKESRWDDPTLDKVERNKMAWAILILAGIFEVIWAYSMKLSEGFTKLTPSIVTIVFMVLSVVLLSMSMRTLPLGTAYTIWTGIGAIGSFIVGIMVLNEPMTAMRMIAAVLIVSGLMLMKLSSN